jgi:hypothetical protein
MNSDPKVLVIILNWNQYELTRDTLHSIQQLDYRNYKVLLIDNGSTDDSLAKLKSDFTDVLFMAAGKNLGVAGGRNVGIAFAREKDYDYLLFLDNDVIVAPDFLRQLVRALESNPRAGGGQSVIFHYDRPDQVCTAGGQFIHLICHHRARKPDGIACPGEDDRPIEVDWLAGGVQLYRTSLFSSLSGFDEDYYPYGCEDAQMGLNLKKNGYTLLLVPGSRIWHRAKADKEWLEFKTKNNASAMVLFLRKNTNRANFPFALLWHLANYVLRYTCTFLLTGRLSQLRALLEGLRLGWTRPIS